MFVSCVVSFLINFVDMCMLSLVTVYVLYCAPLGRAVADCPEACKFKGLIM